MSKRDVHMFFTGYFSALVTVSVIVLIILGVPQ